MLLDGVFNHVGAEHPLFVDAMREGRDSAAAAMFAIDWDAPGGPKPRVFEGHDALVELDHRSPAAADYVTKVLDHWLDRGIDGWRLDAAYAVDPAFWARVLPGVRERHPDAWFVGEMLHGDYADYVARSTLDSVTQYELWKAIWSSLADRNFFELDWTLSRHNEFTAAFTPATFVGNHDVTRIASIVGPDGAVLALTILHDGRGNPVDLLRRRAGIRRGEGGTDRRRRRGATRSSPNVPTSWRIGASEVLRAHQDLIGLRRRHPWLVRARTEQVSLTQHPLHVSRCVRRRRDRGGPRRRRAPRAVVRSGKGEVLWQFGVTGWAVTS